MYMVRPLVIIDKSIFFNPRGRYLSTVLTLVIKVGPSSA